MNIIDKRQSNPAAALDQTLSWSMLRKLNVW